MKMEANHRRELVGRKEEIEEGKSRQKIFKNFFLLFPVG